MSRLRTAVALFVGVALMALSVTSHATQTKANKTFVYIVNYYHDTLIGYMEHADGSLHRCVRVRTPAGPEAVAIAGARFVLVASSRADTISSYRINTRNGTLRSVGVWHEARGANPFSITVTPHGHFAYVANSSNGTISAYRITVAGRLIHRATTHEAHKAIPYHVAFNPDGRFAYVANYGNDTIGMYRRTPGKATLTPLGIYHEPTGDGPYDLRTGPDGHYLYVVDFRSNIVLVLKVLKNGRLSRRDRVAEPFDHHPDSLIIDPSGRYLFVANTSANDITAFHIQKATGRLTRVGHVVTGHYPLSLTLDAAARYVYTVNFGSSTISGYRLNHHTGLLTPLNTTHEAADAGPYAIAAATLPGRTGAARPVNKKTR